MKRLAILLGLLGLALAIALIAYYGAGDVVRALALAGWGLVAVVAFFAVLPMLAYAGGWWFLIARADRPDFGATYLYRWISQSVNTLLPAAQIGGEVVRARLLGARSGRRAGAAASVVADMTSGLVAQVPFLLLGLALLPAAGGEGVRAEILIGAGALLGIVAVFIVAQAAGLFRRFAHLIERALGTRETAALSGGAAALEAALGETYRRRRHLGMALVVRFLGWLAGAGEVWLALWFMGHPVSLAEALMLESLTQGVRTVAFAVPGALGVQEGAFVVLGGLIGLAPDTALGLSLVKRVRELALGLPGLAAWQWIEARRLAGARPGAP